MKWSKKGLIFAPAGQIDWMLTHAAVPFADWIRDDIFRVYFSGRDAQNRAQVGYFEIDITRPEEILCLHDQPVIGLGPVGAYDDSGAISSWIVENAGRKYCYYSGMTVGVTVPFYFYLGLAISDDNGQTFSKLRDAPILERSAVDPYLTGHACVLADNGKWRMWYVSGQRWDASQHPPKHYYHIKYAESPDGVEWSRPGIACIDFASSEEYAIARPCVLNESGRFKMWYTCRGKNYRIGYAESADGINWKRQDGRVGIDVSTSGWDSEMICYAHVFDHRGQRYMLYNGNGYGKTGIGLALLETETRTGIH